MVRMLVSFYTPNSCMAATWLCASVEKTMSIKHDLLGMQRDGWSSPGENKVLIKKEWGE